jgi:hypothetical protein
MSADSLEHFRPQNTHGHLSERRRLVLKTNRLEPEQDFPVDVWRDAVCLEEFERLRHQSRTVVAVDCNGSPSRGFVESVIRRSSREGPR